MFKEIEDRFSRDQAHIVLKQDAVYNESCYDKTCLRGFKPYPAQTGLKLQMMARGIVLSM